MAARSTLRERVERKLQMRIRNTYSGSETTVAGAQFSVEKIDDALNDALAWMDLALVDLKDGAAWMNFTTQNDATVYSVAQGIKKPIIALIYDYDDTAISCIPITILTSEDRRALSAGSFWQASANQSFFTDFRSPGVDGVELFINGGITNGKKVKYWANLEFNAMTSDSDDLSLGERLDKLMVDRATGVCLRDVTGGIYLVQAEKLFQECDDLAKLYNSWRT